MSPTSLAPLGSDIPLGAKPQHLIVSLFALYARQNGNWLSIASVVRLMADLDIDGQSVRSSISRLKQRGLLSANRRDNIAGYSLTDDGLNIVAEGDLRIFGYRRAQDDDPWLIITYSIPESERTKRHAMRSVLTRLGFGTVAPGVWIGPAHLRESTFEALRRAHLDGYAEAFEANSIGEQALPAKVAKWWPLDELAQHYSEFVRIHEGESFKDLDGGRAAFVDYMLAITHWRRLPYADPGLPIAGLPAHWSGLEAERLFTSLHERLHDPALHYVQSWL